MHVVELLISDPFHIIENTAHMKLQRIFFAFGFAVKPGASFRILHKTFVKNLFAVSFDYVSGQSKPVCLQNVSNLSQITGTVDVLLIKTGSTNMDGSAGPEAWSDLLTGEFLNIVPSVVDHKITILTEILRL